MRKGFLNGPVAKKEEVNDEVKKETGAVPKVKPVIADEAKPIKVEAGKKRRRRTRSMGTSLSPSPGRGFFVPGFSKEGEKSMSLTELMDASKVITFYISEDQVMSTDFFLFAGADQHGTCSRDCS